MANIKRPVICVLMLLAILFISHPMLAHAEAEAALSVPDDVRVGSSFDITLTFSADENIGWFETNIVYDSKQIEYVSGDANGGEGNLHLRSFSETEQSSISVTLNFLANKEGRSEITVMNCSVFSPDGVPISTPTFSQAVNVRSADDPNSSTDDDSSVTDPVTESSEDSSESGSRKCCLKSLSLSEGELTPAFSPDIFDYTVKLKSGTSKVEVLGELMSPEDFIWFECSSWLSETEDPKQIIVNIPSEEVKLKITVKDNENAPTVTNIYRIMFVSEAESDSSSVPDDDSSSDSSSDGQTAVVTTAPEESTGEEAAITSASSSADPEVSGMAELRDKLMPWLLTVLLVLIIALILVIYWIRSRTDRKRRKIKSSGSRK